MDDLLRSSILPLLSAIAVFFLIRLNTSQFQSPLQSEVTKDGCSLLPYNHFYIFSQRIVTPEGVISGAVEVKEGRIASVVEQDYQQDDMLEGNMINYGDAVVMPGLIDVHVHLDEPGRAEWEGFESGTRAAAAGGITTLVDMPLNSDPSTISVETLHMKVEAARGNMHVDVGFWGGLVPDNAYNRTALECLLEAGVLGLKSFMCPSGINDFPMTNTSHIKEGLTVLAKYQRPLLVHAELELHPEGGRELTETEVNSRSYSTYLKTRPSSWEQAAIEELIGVAEETKSGNQAEGAHLHIVHLSDSGRSLELIKEAKKEGASITIETCPHYLAFSAEEVQDGDTRFKCAPPIRDAANKFSLWEALKEGHIDMLSSDHSPTTPELKLLAVGDFLKAWGGISSLQFVLPATWTFGKEHYITLEQLTSWWSDKPSKLAGQKEKGAIAVGYLADFVAWDPDAKFEIDDNYTIYHKHRITPYAGRTLFGEVLATYVRGNLVYSNGLHAPIACGVPILAK